MRSSHSGLHAPSVVFLVSHICADLLFSTKRPPCEHLEASLSVDASLVGFKSWWNAAARSPPTAFPLIILPFLPHYLSSCLCPPSPPSRSSVFTLTPRARPPSLILFHYFIRVQTNGLSRLWSTRGGKTYTVSTTPDGKSNDTDCHRPLQGQMLDGARVTAAIAPLMQWGAAEKRDGEGNDLMNDKMQTRNWREKIK